jgi:hypothetical protein
MKCPILDYFWCNNKSDMLEIIKDTINTNVDDVKVKQVTHDGRNLYIDFTDLNSIATLSRLLNINLTPINNALVPANKIKCLLDGINLKKWGKPPNQRNAIDEYNKRYNKGSPSGASGKNRVSPNGTHGAYWFYERDKPNVIFANTWRESVSIDGKCGQQLNTIFKQENL